MKEFFSKLFKKEGSSESPDVEVTRLVEEVITRSGLEISFDAARNEATGEIEITFFGNDEDLFTENEGALLDAIELFVKRALQHRRPDDPVNVTFDCGGFRESIEKELMDLASRLREQVVEKGKPAYVRALGPRDRKVVHQFFAEDQMVKSRSIGEGLFKKIKIFPIENENTERV